MANVRAIRARVKSVESTRKITKSMKMVAAAKLKRTQQSMLSLQPYAEAAREMLSRVSAGPSARDNPFLRERDVQKVLYVLFVGNRGLCGVYNTALLKFAEGCLERETRDASVLVCGRWGRDLMAASPLPIAGQLPELPDAPGMEEVKALSDALKERYLSGEADEIVLLYEHYASALRQEPCAKKLLPVDPPAGGTGERDVILEPDGKSLVDSLVGLYIDNTVRAVVLEAKTGEHSARMTAMTAASDNTEQLLAELNLELNHARQSAITTEISEIVGGANALQSSKEGKRG
ncbi:MAG: ATP synthase F1 subunit gamma [Oscillospiraceae bacterium]|nr:ATP synthase F1 subunit gamma [Oscillospiraceae bacterium]